MGDFAPDGLDSRSLRTLWEWKNRVLLEEYYIFNVAIPLEEAGIINSLGRLRFLTQNIGLVLLPSSHYYLRSLSSDLRDPSPSQILGTSSRFSEDLPWQRERDP